MLSPNPAESCLLSARVLPVCNGSHLPSAGVHTGSQPQGWAGKAHRALGILMSQLGASPCKMWACSSWVVFLISTTKHLVRYMSLRWVLSPGCYVPSISQPLRHIYHLSILGGVRKTWTSLATFCKLQKPCIHSPCSHFAP